MLNVCLCGCCFPSNSLLCEEREREREMCTFEGDGVKERVNVDGSRGFQHQKEGDELCTVDMRFINSYVFLWVVIIDPTSRS